MNARASLNMPPAKRAIELAHDFDNGQQATLLRALGDAAIAHAYFSQQCRFLLAHLHASSQRGVQANMSRASSPMPRDGRQFRRQVITH